MSQAAIFRSKSEIFLVNITISFDSPSGHRVALQHLHSCVNKSKPVRIMKSASLRQFSRPTVGIPRFRSISPQILLRPASSSTTPQSRLTTDPKRPPTHASKYFKNPKPAPSPTSAQSPAARSSAPPNETPAQKVTRLRAARNAEKAAQFSLWDRTVVRGREVVDKAHRWVIRGIIGATGSITPSPPPFDAHYFLQLMLIFLFQNTFLITKLLADFIASSNNCHLLHRRNHPHDAL